jgi:hypothetical protein
MVIVAITARAIMTGILIMVTTIVIGGALTVIVAITSTSIFGTETPFDYSRRAVSRGNRAHQE